MYNRIIIIYEIVIKNVPSYMEKVYIFHLFSPTDGIWEDCILKLVKLGQPTGLQASAINQFGIGIQDYPLDNFHLKVMQ